MYNKAGSILFLKIKIGFYDTYTTCTKNSVSVDIQTSTFVF